MNKIIIVELFNELFNSAGFKKKRNCWLLNNGELSKIICLESSKYSSRLYVNYGYIINSIPLSNLKMHIFNGLGAVDKNENEKIKELLNLENSLSDEHRSSELKKILKENLLNKLQSVNNEKELLEDLKKRPHLNDIPISVKNYFNLE